MDFSALSPEQLGTALTALQQARVNHDQWAEVLHTTMTCRSPVDERDTAEDAHRHCRFGQWCHGAGHEALGQHPGFAEIVHEHERMHRFAAGLLGTIARGGNIEVREYERFLSALKRMRLEIDTLKEEIDTAIHTLDPLTGTPGRGGMLTRLREQHALVQRKKHPCAVAMIDLDHFKQVNDDYGHAAGDKVLTAVARHLAHGLRPYDRLFRYGGEEFLVLLPDTTAEVGRGVLERLREQLAGLRHEVGGSAPIQVTVSCGVADLDGTCPMERSIERADKALYEAKHAGRNRSVVWTEALGADAAA